MAKASKSGPSMLEQKMQPFDVSDIMNTYENLIINHIDFLNNKVEEIEGKYSSELNPVNKADMQFYEQIKNSNDVGPRLQDFIESIEASLNTTSLKLVNLSKEYISKGDISQAYIALRQLMQQLPEKTEERKSETLEENVDVSGRINEAINEATIQYKTSPDALKRIVESYNEILYSDIEIDNDLVKSLMIKCATGKAKPRKGGGYSNSAVNKYRYALKLMRGYVSDLQPHSIADSLTNNYHAFDFRLKEIAGELESRLDNGEHELFSNLKKLFGEIEDPQKWIDQALPLLDNVYGYTNHLLNVLIKSDVKAEVKTEEPVPAKVTEAVSKVSAPIVQISAPVPEYDWKKIKLEGVDNDDLILLYELCNGAIASFPAGATDSIVNRMEERQRKDRQEALKELREIQKEQRPDAEFTIEYLVNALDVVSTAMPWQISDTPAKPEGVKIDESAVKHIFAQRIESTPVHKRGLQTDVESVRNYVNDERIYGSLVRIASGELDSVFLDKFVEDMESYMSKRQAAMLFAILASKIIADGGSLVKNEEEKLEARLKIRY